MTPDQMRAARELLGLSAAAFANIADVSESTVVGFEGGADIPRPVIETMQVALESAGVAFREDGVRLKQAS